MSKQWYYLNASSEKTGPVSSETLKLLVKEGIIGRKTLLLLDGMDRLIEAGKVNGLFEKRTKNSSAPASAESTSVFSVAPASTESKSAYSVAPISLEELRPEQAKGPPPKEEAHAPKHFTAIPTTPELLQPEEAFLPTPAPPEIRPATQAPSPPIAPRVSSPTAYSAAYTAPSPSPHPTSPGFQPDLLDQLFAVENHLPASRPRVNTPLTAHATDPTLQWVLGLAGFALVGIFLLGIAAVVSLNGNSVPVGTSASVETPTAAEKEAARSKQTSSGPRDTETVVAETEASVAFIKGKMSGGTGFVVGPGIIATNSHVISLEMMGDIEVRFPAAKDLKEKGPFKPELLYENPEKDIAFLEIPGKNKPLPLVENYQFRRGQEIIVIGNPGLGDGTFLEITVSRGVMGTEAMIDDRLYYQTSISVNPGNSGGPAFDSEGRVVGVVTLKASQIEGIAYCVPVETLRDLMSIMQSQTEKDRETTETQHLLGVYRNLGLAILVNLEKIPEPLIKENAKKGVGYFDQAIRLDPNDPPSYMCRGLLKTVLSDFSGAIDDLNEAIRLDPKTPGYKQLRAAVQMAWDAQRRTGPGIRSPMLMRPSMFARNGMDRYRPSIEFDDAPPSTFFDLPEQGKK